MEYLEILTGKGSEETDKQLYKFQDHGGRWVGLRFDLTVPLARFAAQHIGQLGTPFKRYHIASVWRGENTQRGRYREFMQCDFDTIGTHSLVADIETTLVIHDLFQALQIRDFTIHVNNRLVLSGMLDLFGLAEKSTPLLRSLDKLAKIGREKVAEEMVNVAGATPDQADRVLQLSEIKGTNSEVLRELRQLAGTSSTAQEGVDKLADLVSAVLAAGVEEQRVRITPSIARGLDYYTGTVFETYLDNLPGIGSVCSGGRYDNLAGLYTKEELPGIGASLGLDRLLAALEELQLVQKISTPAAVFIPFFDAGRLHDYLRLAGQIRALGVGVELYPEPKKLGQQLKYADRRGFRLAVIAGENEFAAGTCQIKDLATAQSVTVPLADAPRTIVEQLQLQK